VYFIACPAEPQTEAMAFVRPNVNHREKKNQMGKRRQYAIWQATKADDSGRVSHGNTRRGEAARLGAVINIPVLGQSQIEMYVGSISQSEARLIGIRNELSDLGKSPPIHFAAFDDILRMLEDRRLALAQSVACPKNWYW
jgi:hypothetical protein